MIVPLALTSRHGQALCCVSHQNHADVKIP
jgi:hypothetical protein